MAYGTNKLSATKVKAIKKPGRHADGGGLYLKVRKSGSKGWVFIQMKNGKSKELGLGSCDVVSLAEARAKALEMKERSYLGLGTTLAPVFDKKPPTFIECVEKYLAGKEQGWTNDKHSAQWHMTLKVYAKPLHDLHVSQIKASHILEILEPMWLTKNETASRLRGRIEAILDYAKAMGWRNGENPALWRGNMKLLLPEYSKVKNAKHHAALDFEDLPTFIADVRAREANVARLLEFIILTAARSGEARFATWSEISFEKRIWTLSAGRMKMSKAHTVPLSDRAIQLLMKLKDSAESEYVFTHPVKKKPFSINATRALLQRMRSQRLTTHGFRSTFRDWAGDQTLHQREVIEAALAHSLKNRAEAAYRRSSALEKRRKLMQDWSNYCDGNYSSPVTL